MLTLITPHVVLLKYCIICTCNHFFCCLFEMHHLLCYNLWMVIFALARNALEICCVSASSYFLCSYLISKTVF